MAVVAQRAVVGALKSKEYYQRVFLNRRTGELFSTREDGEYEAAQEPDSPDLDAWDQQRLAKIREAMHSGDWLLLSVAFDGHRSMERFCDTITSKAIREELLGAFECCDPGHEFWRVIRFHSLTESWLTFYDREFAEFTAQWLGLHGVQCVR